MRTFVKSIEDFKQLTQNWPFSTREHRREWTIDEDELLRTYWELATAHEFADAFKRTEDAIYTRVIQLNIGKRILWTQDETRKLLAGGRKLERSQDAIRAKAWRLARKEPSSP